MTMGKAGSAGTIGGADRTGSARAAGRTRAAGKTRAALAAGLVAVSLVVAGGCGDSGNAGSQAKPELVVSAAASLKQAFGKYQQQFDAADVRTSFAGSDELAAQIEQGIRPDVFAAANTKLPDALYAKGLVEKPVVFAANRLVIAVPARSSVKSIDDLGAKGLKLAAGSPSVPVGSYTRKLLDRLDPSLRAAILQNIRSNEPDVKGIVGKLTQGAVDAGFVYVTDVKTTDGKLKAIELPAKLQPSVAYAAAVVKGTDHPREASAFIRGLLSGPGRDALDAAGFEPPPS